LGCRLLEPFFPCDVEDEGSWKIFNEDGRADVALILALDALCFPFDLADLSTFF
jgi:hypothetical protein